MKVAIEIIILLDSLNADSSSVVNLDAMGHETVIVGD
jgi:hypothetical protein